jgi:hypothetical protein
MGCGSLLDIIMPMSFGRACSTGCSAVVVAATVDVTALLVGVVSMAVVVVSIVVVVVLLLVVVSSTKG